MPQEMIETTWEARTYDVCGNAREGYEVNDTRSAGAHQLTIPVESHNIGTPHKFKSASPTDKQLRKVFGARCKLSTDGDDLTIYVNRERDDYPIGELHCISHDSLSPICAKATVDV